MRAPRDVVREILRTPLGLAGYTLDMTSLSLLLLVVSAGCGSGVHGDPGPLAVDWTEPSESLTAAGFTLIVDGVTFHGTMDQLEVKAAADGDVLDVTWAEASFMPRIHFDFSSDGGTWWIGGSVSGGYGVRAYRLDNSDWIEETGRYYTTPVGQPYEGNLDFTIDQSGHHAEIHFVDARLATLGVQ